MKLKGKLSIVIFVLLAGLAAVILFIIQRSPDILNPAGIIGTKEHQLIVISFLLTMLVVIPVFILTVYIVLKFHEDNEGTKYSPEWDGSRKLELTWWGIPLAIITTLAIITWSSSHQLDPFKPLDSNKPALNIQVVALDWKWLFIYPQQDIATVNYVQFPTDTPIHFQITSDAPMNSFWIPKLGSQIYAMSGMSTQLNLQADQTGVFNGSSANISGRGFAGMDFKAQAVTENEFNNWAMFVEHSNKQLTFDEYAKLAQPSENNPVALYAKPADNLYDHIVMKYMGDGHSMPTQDYTTAGEIHAHSH
jgi:cytochrome o ubiquinol oxidase subunit 2